MHVSCISLSQLLNPEIKRKVLQPFVMFVEIGHANAKQPTQCFYNILSTLHTKRTRSALYQQDKLVGHMQRSNINLRARAWCGGATTTRKHGAHGGAAAAHAELRAQARPPWRRRLRAGARG